MQPKLYEKYSRKEVNYIFEPEKKFTPGAGIYGMHGLIRVAKKNSKPDFIFFVTIGQNKLGYDFTEDISDDGKLNWQSQPSQTLDNERIIQLINHDEKKNKIYLFIRNGKQAKEYTYLGNLKYVKHDTEKEKPVHFIWQIMEWSQNSIDKLREIDIIVKENKKSKGANNHENGLLKVSPPKINNSNANNFSKTINPQGVYKPDYVALQERKANIGEAGEQLILELEKEYLKSQGKESLAEKVKKVSETNDKLGYDIFSFDKYGTKKLIEVKTTTGGRSLGFYVSRNEVEVSAENSENYYIYRIYDFNEINMTGKYYVVKGSIENYFNLEPTDYKAFYK